VGANTENKGAVDVELDEKRNDPYHMKDGEFKQGK
jgi:hypothetical protein